MEPIFDHEKLDVYCVELGFIAWIADFLDDACNPRPGIDASWWSNLTARASLYFSIRPRGTVNAPRRQVFGGRPCFGLRVRRLPRCLVVQRLVSADRVRSGKEKE
jgi:hypothetical protein